jgi:biopolymer transport protein ExbD
MQGGLVIINRSPGTLVLALVVLAGCGASQKNRPAPAGRTPGELSGKSESRAGAPGSGSHAVDSVTIGEQEPEKVETTEDEFSEEGAVAETGPGEGAAGEENAVIIVITKKGETMVDNKAVSKDDIQGMLAEKYKANPSAKIVIRADGDAHYGKVVEIMEAARAVGFSHIGLAVKGK